MGDQTHHRKVEFDYWEEKRGLRFRPVEPPLRAVQELRRHLANVQPHVERYTLMFLEAERQASGLGALGEKMYGVKDQDVWIPREQWWVGVLTKKWHNTLCPFTGVRLFQKMSSGLEVSLSEYEWLVAPYGPLTRKDGTPLVGREILDGDLVREACYEERMAFSPEAGEHLAERQEAANAAGDSAFDNWAHDAAMGAADHRMLKQWKEDNGTDTVLVDERVAAQKKAEETRDAESQRRDTWLDNLRNHDRVFAKGGTRKADSRPTSAIVQDWVKQLAPEALV